MKQGVLVVLLYALAGLVLSENDRPIIGIYTQPSDPDLAQYGSQFIAASYVKYIESAGARVVPIRYDLSTEELTALFSSINGVLFPGGGVDFGTEHVYWQNAVLLWNLITAANEKGDSFPLWGTCMGFQEINILRSNNMSLLSPTDSENYTVPISFTSAAASSRIFSGASSNIMNILATEPVTMNNHHYSVVPSSYAEDSNQLGNFFDILSTNVDRNGVEFISTIEAKKYPIYASQWHPEKVAFEWNIHEVTNHSPDSLLANSWVQNFFVNEARKSDHAFPTVEAETASLIYNYQPVYIYSIVNDFEQGYFFDSVPSSA